MFLSNPITEKSVARDAIKATNASFIKSEGVDQGSKAPATSPISIANKHIQAPVAVVEAEEDDGSTELEEIDAAKHHAGLMTPIANSDCAPNLEATALAAIISRERQQSLVKHRSDQGEVWCPVSSSRNWRQTSAYQDMNLPNSDHRQTSFHRPFTVQETESRLKATSADYQEQNSSSLRLTSIPHDPFELEDASLGCTFPNQRPGHDICTISGNGAVDHANDLAATEIQRHTPVSPLRSPAAFMFGFAGSSSGLAGLDWYDAKVSHSGSRAQQFSINPYSYWNPPAATPNTSFSSDCTVNSGLLCNSSSLEYPWNQTQDEATEDQYSAFMASDFDTSTINPTYLTKRPGSLGGNCNLYSPGPRPR